MRGYAVKPEYVDHRFERIGVERQHNANTYAQAKHDYMHSCELCCTRGACGALRCVSCQIRGAFLENANVFGKHLSEEEKDWIQGERELR